MADARKEPNIQFCLVHPYGISSKLSREQLSLHINRQAISHTLVTSELFLDTGQGCTHSELEVIGAGVRQHPGLIQPTVSRKHGARERVFLGIRDHLKEASRFGGCGGKGNHLSKNQIEYRGRLAGRALRLLPEACAR